MKNFTTSAVIIEAPHDARVTDLTVLRAPSDVLMVRVELCGVCTPEQRVYRGAKSSYPYWGGHELSAVVEEATADAQPPLPAPGTRVAVALMPRCGRCHACLRGLDNHCAYLFPRPRDSAVPAGPRGFATRLAIAPHQAFAFPPEIPTEVVALTEPLACCLRSIAMAGVRADDIVSVHGCGTMGRLHAAVLVRMGCRVVISDCDPNARAAADMAVRGLAAPSVAPDALAEVVALLSDGAGSRAAFCTRGGGDAVAAAISASARGGSVVLYQSVPTAPRTEIDINELHYREIKLVGTIAQSAVDLAMARNFLVAHPDIIEALAIEVFGFEVPDRALGRALAPEVNRVMIDFR